MQAVEIENAVKTYQMGEVETRALDGIDLTIDEGEFTALVGPSGSGKTTLLQLMGCLDRPDSGSVKINGKDVIRLKNGQRADLRREHIGFIFQFFALVPVLSAYENVELPLLLERRWPQGAQRARPGTAGRGRSVRPDRPPPRPVERRRAAARGDRARPGAAPLLVLADEPTANLDTENGTQAMEIMQRLNQETGTAFVFATHDPRVVAYAGRVVKLLDGQIIDDGNGSHE